MPPRFQMWPELDEILKKSKPADADPPPAPRPKPPGPPSAREVRHSRTRKIILKTLSLSTVITALIVIIGIYSAFSFINPFSKYSTDNPLDKYRPYTPSLKDVDTLAAYQPERIDAPYGRILSPKPGADSPSHIRITGITRNIPEGYHVVLVVDVESQRICVPKWPIIECGISHGDLGRRVGRGVHGGALCGG